MYHAIGTSTNETGSGLYCVPENKFQKQLAYLAQQRDAGREFRLTFDDGDITNYTTALPTLEKYGFKGYFFIISGFIGTDGYMNEEQIRELYKKGHSIGSHGMSHRILEGLTDVDLAYEIKESKIMLERIVSARINSFSIPRGFENPKIMRMAREIGYTTVFTSNPMDNDGFKTGRIAVKGKWGMEYFKRVVSSGPSLKENAQEWLKTKAKRVLGAKQYDKLRSKLLRK